MCLGGLSVANSLIKYIFISFNLTHNDYHKLQINLNNCVEFFYILKQDINILIEIC